MYFTVFLNKDDDDDAKGYFLSGIAIDSVTSNDHIYYSRKIQSFD